jgi:hypothetical protein
MGCSPELISPEPLEAVTSDRKASSKCSSSAPWVTVTRISSAGKEVPLEGTTRKAEHVQLFLQWVEGQPVWVTRPEERAGSKKVKP